MKRKYTHFGYPVVAGIYYYAGDTYCKNLDSRDGKIIVMMPVKKEKGHRAAK